MADVKKFLDQDGLAVLWKLLQEEHEKHKAETVEDISAILEDGGYVKEEDLKDLIDAVRFIGVKDSLEDVEEPKVGDIVIVNGVEYIYSEDAEDQGVWQQFGDENAVYEPQALTEEEIRAICVSEEEEEPSRNE